MRRSFYVQLRFCTVRKKWFARPPLVYRCVDNSANTEGADAELEKGCSLFNGKQFLAGKYLKLSYNLGMGHYNAE